LYHMAAVSGKGGRFDIDLLDSEDPFEIDDGNRIHLFKHLAEDDRGRLVAVGPEDILDVYLYGDPDYEPARADGDADWVMIGTVPGLVVCVPLALPNCGDVRLCRPIGIYKASTAERSRYLRGDVVE
jgi:hypothetical protein